MIDNFNMEARTGENGVMLSGGEKKKIQIINALLMDRPITIFDEPTNNLDVDTVDWYMNVLKYLIRQNKLVIIISHDKRLINKNSEIIEYEDIIQT